MDHPLLKLRSSIPIAAQRVATGERHMGYFIGTYQMDCVIVAGFTECNLSVGEKLVVRMIARGKALGFHTAVHSIIPNPPMYLLEFPIEVQSYNLRKSERIPVFFPAEVHMQTDHPGGLRLELLNAMVVDLSSGGCSLTTKRPIHRGQKLKVSFTLPGERIRYTLTGKVINTDVQESAFIQRLRFVEAHENVAEIGAISRWVQLNAGFVTHPNQAHQ